MTVDDALTVSTALKDGTLRLAVSSDTARLDARLLLQHVTGLSHADIIGWPDHRLSIEETLQFSALIARRANGEPIAQILGTREFWGMPFKVTSDVLSPRPDSETLIELALETVRIAPKRILDLGTGSGCLLAALLHEFPEAQGTGVDISRAALQVAAENFQSLGLASRTKLLNQDFAVPMPVKYDLVITNPPYIPDGERETLATEVKEHEPGIALFAGAEGLDAYLVLAHMLPNTLERNGIAIIEAGAGQATAIAELMVAGFAAAGRNISVVTKPDLGGHDRAVGLLATS